MSVITSRDNQKLKLARRVREGREKDLIFIEGGRLAEEALRSPLSLKESFATPDFLRSERGREIARALEKAGVTVYGVGAALFDSIADTKTSQGVILLAARPETDAASFAARMEKRAARLPIVLLLHRINNPSNLGAILRTAEAVDAAGVIVSNGSADVFSPKALRAAMGAALRLPIWSDAGFAEALAWARTRRMTTTAADVNARNSYASTDWRRPRLLVFGSEAHGLSAGERAEIEEMLIIPMANEVESLNLAVSCGVILFEAKRQHDAA